MNYAANPDGQSRLGLAIAKRVLPRAVDRNRVKRLVRESFRHRRQDLPAVDVIVHIRGKKQQGVPASFESCLDEVWRRLAKR